MPRRTIRNLPTAVVAHTTTPSLAVAFVRSLHRFAYRLRRSPRRASLPGSLHPTVAFQAESLESRVALDAEGSWSGDRSISLSFADDGIDIAGAANAMGLTFAKFDSEQWQATVLQALQSMADVVSREIGRRNETGNW